MFDFWKKKKDRQGEKPKNHALSHTGKTISLGRSRLPDNIAYGDGRFYLKTGAEQKSGVSESAAISYSQPGTGIKLYGNRKLNRNALHAEI